MKHFVFVIAAMLFSAVSCSQRERVEVSDFGTLSGGGQASLFHIVNSSGASMDVTNYGARIVRIFMPDREGRLDDVVVGPGRLEDFEKGDRFFGPVIGRFGNRINHSAFTLDGVRYTLEANESFDGVPVQCHGGPEGFDRKMWDAQVVEDTDRQGVRMTYVSPDGEAGYPGTMEAVVTYWLTENNAVVLEYEATSDKPTVVNLSNHTYFNLKGREAGYVMEHFLQVDADTCVQNNLQYCPDLLLPVNGTPFDFREPHRVDYRIDTPSRHLEIMHGMSACWVLRNWDGSLHRAADLYDSHTGRGIETWTTEPALLTYTGRGFSVEKYPYGKYGPIDKFDGMLLETIHFPDSPNQPRFPSTVLRPGETYSSRTEWRFYAR